MNSTVYRACLAIYSLAWIFFCLALAAFTWNRDQQLDLSAGDLTIRGFIDAGDGGVRLAFSALMFVLALVGVLTFILALTKPRPENYGRTLRVRSPGGESSTVPVLDVEALLAAELKTYPGIRAAQVRLRARDGMIVPETNLTLAPDASAGYTQALAIEVIESVLHDRIGAESIAAPEIRTRYDTTAPRPRRDANATETLAIADELEPEPLPQIQWDATEVRAYRPGRLAWRQADHDRPAND